MFGLVAHMSPVPKVVALLMLGRLSRGNVVERGVQGSLRKTSEQCVGGAPPKSERIAHGCWSLRQGEGRRERREVQPRV